MLERNHNTASTLLRRILLLLLICVYFTTFSCGGKGKSSGGSVVLSVPDYLKTPLEVSAVPIGSRDTTSYPSPGIISGKLLLQLFSEPEAKTYFSFQELTAASEGTEYTTPILLIPPVTVWAISEKDGEEGPVRSFVYTQSAASMPNISPTSMPRLPRAGHTLTPLQSNVTSTLMLSLGIDERLPFEVTLDGEQKEWSGQGRTFAVDPIADVPEPLSHIDISWIQAGEDDTYIYVTMSLASAPLTRKGVSYGFDLGPSNVTTANFGPGANLYYNIAVDAGALKIYERSTLEELPVGDGTLAHISETVEFRILKSDLPAIANKTDIVLRPSATDWSTGTTVSDIMQPIYLRSTFAIKRAQIETVGDRNIQLDFLLAPSLASSGFAANNLAILKSVIPDIEALSTIPLYNYSSIPVFFSLAEYNGYSGLNSSERGVLTTTGPNSSIISKTQLLAHEMAHFQNAVNAKTVSHWIEEGMSEWAAERVLYHHFPSRAAHNFMKQLRIDPYFDATGGGLDDFPLSSWEAQKSLVAYSKTLMFFDLLEARLGQETVIKAFRHGVNAPMTGESLQKLLETESGTDLDHLFSFWVNPGPLASNADPRQLYKDLDNDDLLGIDEEILGTDPNNYDTDGDGFGDGEEYFKGENPLVSLVGSSSVTPLKVVHPMLTSTDTSALLRLASEPGAEINFSANRYAAVPLGITLDGPLFYRPPYSIKAEATADGSTSASPFPIDRGLYIDGIEVTVTAPGTVILPSGGPTAAGSPHASLTLNTLNDVPGLDFALLDFDRDLPNFLSAYDSTSFSWNSSGGALTLTLPTNSSPDAYGMYGNYVFTFDNISWNNTTGPTLTRKNVLTIAEGSPFLNSFDGSNETTVLLSTGINYSFSPNLSITLDETKISEWDDSTDEKMICASAINFTPGNSKIKDSAGCVYTESSEFDRKSGTVDDFYGAGQHTVEIFFQSDFSEAEVDTMLNTGLMAIRHFESSTQRPFLDRSYWPIHLFHNAGTTAGSGDTLNGAFLAIDSSQDPEVRDYLLVEQLARTHVSDIVDRQQVTPPYWIQEVYIQWLTAMAMYQIYSTVDANYFPWFRIKEFASSCSSTCDDVYLPEWDSTTISSNGSVKSLLLAMFLEMELGTAAMSNVFATFANRIPDIDEFEDLLKGFASTKTTEITNLYLIFIDGSGIATTDLDAILAYLMADVNDNTTIDDDDDSLFLFQETALGNSDNASTDYFNPAPTLP